MRSRSAVLPPAVLPRALVPEPPQGKRPAENYYGRPDPVAPCAQGNDMNIIPINNRLEFSLAEIPTSNAVPVPVPERDQLR